MLGLVFLRLVLEVCALSSLRTILPVAGREAAGPGVYFLSCFWSDELVIHPLQCPKTLLMQCAVVMLEAAMRLLEVKQHVCCHFSML